MVHTEGGVFRIFDYFLMKSVNFNELIYERCGRAVSKFISKKQLEWQNAICM